MNQRSIVEFLHVKELSTKAKDIHTELVQVLGPDAIAYSTVAKDIRNNMILQNEPEANHRAEDHGFSITDNVILEGFETMSFAPIRQIAKTNFITPTTGFHRLTRSLQFVLKRLR
jgi:hypothetical protein